MQTISFSTPGSLSTLIGDVEFARRLGRDIGRPLPSANLPLYLQILQPTAAVKALRGQGDPVPVVIFVPGGGFARPMSKGRVTWASGIAGKGFLTVVTDYRGYDAAPFPAPVEDLVTAIRYVRKNAALYGGAPERIVLLGGSAGGYLSLMAAYAGDQFSHPGDDRGVSCEVSGVIDLYGPVDPLFAGAGEGSVARRMSGARTEEEARQKLVSAQILRVIGKEKKLPPTLILHGDADPLVPVSQSELLLSALLEAGQDAEGYLVAGLTHADPRFFEEDANELYARFIRRVTANTQ